MAEEPKTLEQVGVSGACPNSETGSERGPCYRMYSRSTRARMCGGGVAGAYEGCEYYSEARQESGRSE